MASQFDADKIAGLLKDLLVKVQTEADPQMLNRYRSVFRKEIPFFSRSYVAAYLIMTADQQGKAGKEGKEGRQAPFKAAGGRIAPKENHQLKDEDAINLFFSAGRNRRIFPREILGFILSKAPVSREDIGAIRILDNYSFVQVRASLARSIIQALNGAYFRGKPLMVNYGRKKEPDESVFEAQDETGEEKEEEVEGVEKNLEKDEAAAPSAEDTQSSL